MLAAPAAAQGLDDISIAGDHFVAGGQAVRLVGVSRSGSEYACTAGNSPSDPGFAIFQGPVENATIEALLSWHINTVALPLNEACWLGGSNWPQLKPEFTGTSYRSAIVDYVDRLNSAGIYVVLRLSGAAPGSHAFLEPTPQGPEQDPHEIPMPDADHSLAFWTSVATTFRTNHKVLFHAYDEPNGADVTWSCLRNGCPTTDLRFDGTVRYGAYQAVGHQAIVNAIRGANATQPILLSGIEFAGVFDSWLGALPTDPMNQLAANASAFDYATFVFDAAKPHLATISESHPVVFGGFGDTDCNSDFSQSVMQFADQHGMSYLAWTWNTVQDYGGCANALLDDNTQRPDGQPAGYYSANPSGFGAGVRDHFIGGSPPPPPPAVPPSSVVAPKISGTASVGFVLTCSTGTWSGTTPMTVSVVWVRDGQPIAGATSNQYTVAGDDAGRRLGCRVTATNSAGSATASSATVKVPRNRNTEGLERPRGLMARVPGIGGRAAR